MEGWELRKQVGRAGSGRQTEGRMERESNKRNCLMTGNFGVREKPGARENPRNPQIGL